MNNQYSQNGRNFKTNHKQMNNPFEIIDRRLSIIENLLIELKQHNLKKEFPETHATKFLNRRETASLLGISLGSLNSYTKSSILKAYRIGNRVLYKEKEILEESVSQIKSFKYRKGLID